jgi:hypothetical protein
MAPREKHEKWVRESFARFSLRIHQGRYREVEDKWERLRQIIREEVGSLLDERELKKKTPIRFENGQWTGITKEQSASWEAAYGSCNIQEELKKAAAWLLSNPNRAPRDKARFLNAWFSRQQDRSAIRSIPTRNEVQDTKKFCAYCGRPRVGIVSGIAHCSEHTRDAMDGKEPDGQGSQPKRAAFPRGLE